MDFSNRKISAEWLRTLPLSDIRAAARMLYTVVKELNNQQLVLRHHFDFLEQIGPSVALVLRNLEKYYADAHFPLAPSARNAAKMSDELCELLLISYQLVLRQLSTPELVSNRDDPRRKVWERVAHRILYYSLRILTNQLLLDLEDRSNFWLRIYRLLSASQALSAQHLVIDFEGVKEYPESSVHDLIKRILMISLVPLRSLRSSQIRELYQSAGVWAEKIQLLPCQGKVERKETPFLFNSAQDVGPGHLAGCCDACPQAKCILINTSLLQRQITQWLLQAAREGAHQVAVKPDLLLSVSTLETLRNHWKGRPKRTDHRSERKEAQRQEIDLVVGIKGLHAALQAGESSLHLTPLNDPPAKPTTQSKRLFTEISSSALEARFAASMGEQGEAKLQSANPWAAITERRASIGEQGEAKLQLDGVRSGGGELGESSAPPEEKVKPLYALYSACVKDFSRSGYRMEIYHQKALRLRIGDLLSLRERHKSGFTLGVVRWVRELDEHRISCGVLMIAHNPEVASFQFAGVNQSLDQPCLLAEHARSGKTLLMLDHLPTLRDARVMLLFNEVKIPIAFNGWPVEESRSFEAYEFGLRQRGGNLPNPDFPMFDLLSLRALTQSKGVSGDSPSSSPAPASAPKSEKRRSLSPEEKNPWSLE